jgi:hypothetical protein
MAAAHAIAPIRRIVVNDVSPSCNTMILTNAG